MSARLTLVAHASTAATARAAFAIDEGLEPRGRAAATAARGRLGRVARAVCSPAAAARETAAAMGLAAAPDPGVADWDLGAWRGHTLDELLVRAPDAVRAWLDDPEAAPHGGERLSALLARVGAWLDRLDGAGLTVAVTHAAVVRAAVVVTLAAPPSAFWRIDIAPMTSTVLRGGPGRWTLRGTALPLGGA